MACSARISWIKRSTWRRYEETGEQDGIHKISWSREINDGIPQIWFRKCLYIQFLFTKYHEIMWQLEIIEGSLEVKLPTIWRDEKAVSREKSQKRKDQKKEDAGARKGRKVAKHCVFSWFCGSGGLKSRLAKAAGAETSGEMRDEKLHAVVARSRFRSEKVQNTAASDHFWKFRCWKVHGVVARSTFGSKMCEKLRGSDHFWKLRCWKSARRCGSKHISKSKCTKHTMVGPLLEVEMSKKCTLLWREAHFEVKMYKTHYSRTTFGSWDVEKCTALWRKAHFQVKMYKTHHVRTIFGG